ncbi:MAG: GDP-mannose 4,6-dehydratase [Butyrivibrio sp.]|nr:GDP-mannose 4,6-dehydratase [Butyrivibrio sp.]
MNKLLITGFSGFVASHFIEYLYKEKLQYDVCGIDINEPTHDYGQYSDFLDIDFKKADMMDIDRVHDILTEFQPDYILHLAAFSSVAYSWKHPSESFMNNCNIFLNLVSVVRDVCPNCRILSVGSSEEYGNVPHENLPIRENQRKEPLSPYAVARVSQEMLSKVYVDAYGMDIVLTRSFNHIGPRQDERFVVPSFIRRILDIKKSGRIEGEIETGDLTIVRDFVDVRDVVKAYHLLLTSGKKGEVYNICSGKGITLQKIVDMIADEAGVRVVTRTNPEFVRPSDNMEIVGSAYKLESELGWKREYKFDRTIRDMVAYME